MAINRNGASNSSAINFDKKVIAYTVKKLKAADWLKRNQTTYEK